MGHAKYFNSVKINYICSYQIKVNRIVYDHLIYLKNEVFHSQSHCDIIFEFFNNRNDALNSDKRPYLAT